MCKHVLSQLFGWIALQRSQKAELKTVVYLWSLLQTLTQVLVVKDIDRHASIE